MKKRHVFGFVVAGLLAGFVSHAVAQSATAYSSTAVGVIKRTLPAKKLACVSVPLDQEPIVEGGVVIDGFKFASIPGIANLPNGCSVNFWDAETQSWIPQDKSKAGWGAQKDRIIKPGEAFFLFNNQTTNIEMILSGTVPPDSSIGVGFVSNALSSVGSPYPVAYTFQDFAFASALASGSSANFWDEENQSWIPQDKTKSGWGTQKDRVIKPGEGFFIFSKGKAYEWRESRPYTWPDLPSED